MAFTDNYGEPESDPLKPVNDLGQRWQTWLDAPGNRQALLQFGLQMMQPVALGQSPGGHLAQSIGHGAAAASRYDEHEEALRRQSVKEDQGQQALDIKNEREINRLLLGEANIETRRAQRGAVDANRALVAERAANTAYSRYARGEAARIEKIVREHSDINEALGQKLPREYEPFKGKSAQEIFDAILSDPSHRARFDRSMNRASPSALPSGAPLSQVLGPNDASPLDPEDTGTDTIAGSEVNAENPPIAGAQYFPGNAQFPAGWYIQKNGTWNRILK